MFETLNSETKEASASERMGLYERNKLQATIVDILDKDESWLLKNGKEISNFIDGKISEPNPELQEVRDRVWELTDRSLVKKSKEDSLETEEIQEEIERRFREAAIITIEVLRLERLTAD